MSYDWHRSLAAEEGSPEFFREIDRRFFESSPFYLSDPPFARLIPFDRLRGKRVLEVGCGLGAHAMLFAETGCELTAVDLTPRAIEMTRKRLTQLGLAADVRQMDAERMEFGEGEFDFVWSWGVIHHSADPARILREMLRVLKPSGEVRLMVYHRRSLNAWYFMARGILTAKFLQGMSPADMVSHYSDGYVARSYTREEFASLLRRCGFADVTTSVVGQTSEIVPLPGRGVFGRMKSALVSAIPGPLAETVLSRLGYFLFATARKPAT